MNAWLRRLWYRECKHLWVRAALTGTAGNLRLVYRFRGGFLLCQKCGADGGLDRR